MRAWLTYRSNFAQSRCISGVEDTLLAAGLAVQRVLMPSWVGPQTSPVTFYRLLSAFSVPREERT